MKPGEHPDFFRFPAPEGRSRESTIVLDREGRFLHEGNAVDHPKLAAALHTWIARHPDDGRYILTNGYDWTYFVVEDVPFFVRAVHEKEGEAMLVLSDGTEEPLDPATVVAKGHGELYLTVKPTLAGGPFEAKFTRFAKTQLDPFLQETNEGVALATARGRVLLKE